jgi:hypothetical protein
MRVWCHDVVRLRNVRYFEVFVSEDDIGLWKVLLRGPEHTPYEVGKGGRHDTPLLDAFSSSACLSVCTCFRRMDCSCCTFPSQWTTLSVPPKSGSSLRWYEVREGMPVQHRCLCTQIVRALVVHWRSWHPPPPTPTHFPFTPGPCPSLHSVPLQRELDWSHLPPVLRSGLHVQHGHEAAAVRRVRPSAGESGLARAGMLFCVNCPCGL